MGRFGNRNVGLRWGPTEEYGHAAAICGLEGLKKRPKDLEIIAHRIWMIFPQPWAMIHDAVGT